MRRMSAVVLSACIVILAAGSIAFLLWRSDKGTNDAAPLRRPAAAAGPEVAEALRRLAGDPQSLVAAPAKQMVDGRARTAVPFGTVVEPHARSWQPDSSGGGSMLVTLHQPGGPALDYLAVVVHEPSGWKVLGTLPVNGEAPPDGGARQ